MRLSVASAVALLAVAACGCQAIAEDAVANAQKCSEDALARYAGSSSEPAGKIVALCPFGNGFGAFGRDVFPV
jgi:hypothetical protein